MARVNKIDSNIISLRIAQEASYKTLGANPAWRLLEPNSFADFGGAVSTIVRNPINPSRQRRKGIVSDLDASGGFNMDVTENNLHELLQGYLFADIRDKGSAETDQVISLGSGIASIDVTGTLPALKTSSDKFATLGLVPGQWIFIGGDVPTDNFAQTANNGFKRIRAITAREITIDKSDKDMVIDDGSGKNIKLYIGRRVIKNETGLETSNPIVRRSYQLERQLGAPDDAQATQIQAEYLTGLIANEMTINIPSADKINADLTFIGADSETIDGPTALKSGTRPDLTPGGAFNTSSDFSRIRLARVLDGDEAPDALFAFAQEMSISINNNTTPNKAIGTLGNFDVTAGTFQVGGSITAYFADIDAVKAVRDNASITYDLVAVKGASGSKHGFAIDVPLITLGDARPAVEIDSPITLPLTLDAAAGVDVHENLNHTILFTFFDRLPNAADA